METARRALRPLILSSLLLLAGTALPPEAASAPAGPAPGEHPSMTQVWIDGRPVCLLHREGVTYGRPGECTRAPVLKEPESPGGGLPPGHPPVRPDGGMEVPRGSLAI